MKLLFDFFPIILFFVAYKLYGIFTATAVAIVASICQVAYYRWKHGRFEPMHLVTLGLIVVFGGATLILQDKHYIMWKPSVVNWLFAAAFLASHLVGRKTLVERMMGEVVQIPNVVWRRLNLSWIVFFVSIGLANLYVANLFFEADAALEALTGAPLGDANGEFACTQRFAGEALELCQHAHSSEQAWVNFKLFGMLGLTMVFILAQAFYMARHMDAGKKSEPDGRTEES